MLHWMVASPQFDGRFVGRYTQEWVLTGVTAISTWDRMGYDPSSDNGAQQWRDVYWTFGQNLIDMTTSGGERVGSPRFGLILKAGCRSDRPSREIIVRKDRSSETAFNYAPQEYASQEARALAARRLFAANHARDAVTAKAQDR